jgi:hypothetical protein
MKEDKGIIPLITGGLSLIADSIAIISLFYNPTFLTSIFAITFFFLLSVYAWLALSWYGIRRNFLRQPEGTKQRRLPAIRPAVIGWGIISLTISVFFSYHAGFPFYLIIIGVYPLVYYVLYNLLPNLYPEMRIFLTRVGGYTCRHYIMAESGTTIPVFIDVGETIQVIGSHRVKGEIIPKHYLFRLRHQEGYLSYKDLISNFKVGKRADRLNSEMD